MKRRIPAVRALAILGAVLAAGLLYLPGLGRYGLWDPPRDWKVVIQRQEPEGSAKAGRRAARPEPFSEIAVAERARVALGAEGKEAQRNEGDLRVPPALVSLPRTSLKLFGVSDWAVRLPSALAALLLVLVLGLFLWSAGLLPEAWPALAVLAGTPALVLQARLAASHLPAALTTSLAVLGLGAAVLETRRAWVRWAWLAAGIAGLAAGRWTAGGLMGVTMPALAVAAAAFLALLFRRDGGQRKALRNLAIGSGILAALSGAWAMVEVLKGGGWFLAVEPRAATSVLSFAGNKTPPSELAVYDILVRTLVHGTFPWVALLPAALAVLLAGSGRRAEAVGGELPGGEEAPEGRAGGGQAPSGREGEAHETGQGEREVAAGGEPGSESGDAADGAAQGAGEVTGPGTPDGKTAWPVLLLTSWLLFAFLLGTYWNLRCADQPFLGLAALAGLVGLALGRLAGRGAPMRAAAAAVTALAVAVILRDYVDFPHSLPQSVLNYRIEFPDEVHYRSVAALVGLSFLALMFAAFLVRPRKEQDEWPSELLDWLAVRAEAEGLRRLADWSWLQGRRAILGYPLAAGLVLVDLVVGAVKAVVFSFLLRALFAHPVRLAWHLETQGLVGPVEGIVPEPERRCLAQLLDRIRTGPGPERALWILAALVLALPWVLFLLLRVFTYLLLTAVAAAFRGLGFLARRAGLWEPGGVRRTWILAGVGAAALAWGTFAAQGLVPALSRHFSPKAVFQTYEKARSKEHPEPVALYKVESRSARFYSAGHVITEAELRKRYPWTKVHADPLLAYLAEPNRVFALVGSSYLGNLEQRSRKAGIPYYVLDDRSHWFLLVTNKLRPGERDRNPLRKLVRSEPPRRIPQRIHAVFKVPSSPGDQGDLELLGVDLPRVIRKGHKFTVTCYFKVNRNISGDWKVFMHFDGPGLRFFGDHEPLEGKYPTRYWTAGTYIVDPHVVPSRETSRLATPSGIYHVWMGLYRGDTRMTVLSGPKDNANRVDLGTVRVVLEPGISCK